MWVELAHAGLVPHVQSEIKAVVNIVHKIKFDGKTFLPSISYSCFCVNFLFFNQRTYIPEVTIFRLPF